MYMVPLKYVTVGPGVAICATRIVAMMDTGIRRAKIEISKEKKAGTLINATPRGLDIKTAIFLDNGTVIASPYTVTALMNSISKIVNRDVSVTRAPRSDANERALMMKYVRDVKPITCEITEEVTEDEDSESDIENYI